MKFFSDIVFDVIVAFVLCNIPNVQYLRRFYSETNDLSNHFIQKQMICLTSTCMSYLNKDLLLECFVYLILSQKIVFDK
jgi:hypothetical protein